MQRIARFRAATMIHEDNPLVSLDPWENEEPLDSLFNTMRKPSAWPGLIALADSETHF